MIRNFHLTMLVFTSSCKLLFPDSPNTFEHRGHEFQLVAGTGIESIAVPCPLEEGLGIAQVNCARNLFVELSMPGVETSFYYNSHVRDLDLGVGKGMSLSWDRLLEETPDGYKVTDGSGYVTYYEIAANIPGTTQYLSEANGRLEKVSSSLFREWLGDGAYLEYVDDNPGHLTRMVDSEGRVTEIQRRSNGNVERVDFPFGHSLEFGWSNSRLEEVKAYSNGQETAVAGMIYDDATRLIRLVSPQGRTISFFYDENDRLTKLVRDGFTTIYEYDGDFFKTARYPHSRPFSVSSDENTLTSTGGWDKIEETTLHFTSSGGKKRISSIVTRVLEGETVLREDITTYTRDQLGRPTRIEDNAGQATDYVYAGDNWRVVEERSANQPLLERQYDVYGNTTRTSIGGRFTDLYEYNTQGKVTKVTTNGHETLYERDAYGRITKLTTPLEGEVFAKTYNTDGMPISEIVDGCESTYSYDRDLLIRSEDCLGRVVTYSYDGQDRLVQMVSPENIVTSFVYGEDGSLKEKSVSKGNHVIKKSVERNHNHRNMIQSIQSTLLVDDNELVRNETVYGRPDGVVRPTARRVTVNGSPAELMRVVEGEVRTMRLPLERR